MTTGTSQQLIDWMTANPGGTPDQLYAQSQQLGLGTGDIVGAMTQAGASGTR